MKQYYVEIVKEATDDQKELVAKRMGPMTERRAEKTESGASINLDHEHYFTRIVEADEDETTPENG